MLTPFFTSCIHELLLHREIPHAQSNMRWMPPYGSIHHGHALPSSETCEAITQLLMQVMPELTAASVDDLPILKADALKFLTLMRGQLSTQSVLSTFGSLANLLRADSNVVHSYAAVTVERLLASRVRLLSPPKTSA